MKKIATIGAVCASAVFMIAGTASAHDLPNTFAPCDSAISIFPYGGCVGHGHFYHHLGVGHHAHVGILTFPSDAAKSQATQAPGAEAPKAAKPAKAAEAPKAAKPAKAAEAPKAAKPAKAAEAPKAAKPAKAAEAPKAAK